MTYKNILVLSFFFIFMSNNLTYAQNVESNSNQKTIKGQADSTLLQGKTDSTLLQGKTDSTILQSGTDSTLLQSQTQSIGQEVNILFILDASLSMKEKINDGSTKMECAKKVLQEAISKIPEEVNIGLRVFGQTYCGIQGMDCRSSLLLVPIGKDNRRSIIERLRQIIPSGLTPLEYAIDQAAQDDFSGISGAKTIILITDGAETCGGDPCKYVRSLPLMGIKLKIDVVGLDLKNEPRAKFQLNCISESSGGKYYDANSSQELVDTVSKSVNKAIEGKILKVLKY